ncbi:hypothetical protein HQ560_21120 [bacterium]|nr:hypothetical protein [bacterium]
MGKVLSRRRDFLAASLAGAGSLLCAGVACSAPSAALSRRAPWDRAAFADRVGSTFRFRSGDGEHVDMRLVETTEFRLTSRDHARHASRRPFSAVFHAAEGIALPQDTYLVRHRQLGTFQLFIVPVGPEPGHYEAIFS